MAVPKNLIRDYKALGEWNILHAYRGSYAHGTRMAPDDPAFIDDIDTIGVCIPPPEYYLGLREFAGRGAQEIKYQEYDIVVYELLKTLRLLSAGNPNMLAMMWMERNKYMHLSSAGEMLLESKSVFSSKRAYKPFIGYAYGQLHRMEHSAFEGYMGAKRKALVEVLGYDAKNLSHCIRILRMGIEFLTEGRLHVERPDAQELMAIKRGEWTLEQGKTEAERLKKLAEEAYIRSSLPDDVDYDKINRLSISMIKTTWNERGEY